MCKDGPKYESLGKYFTKYYIRFFRYYEELSDLLLFIKYDRKIDVVSF